MDAVHIGKETVISIHFEEKFSVVQFGHIDTVHIQRKGSGWPFFFEIRVLEKSYRLM